MGLLDELIDHIGEFAALFRAAGDDFRASAQADLAREAFLDHDKATKAILCAISYSEAAAIEEAVYRVLAMKERRAIGQFIQRGCGVGTGFGLVRAIVAQIYDPVPFQPENSPSVGASATSGRN
jgi:hypothetical protein